MKTSLLRYFLLFLGLQLTTFSTMGQFVWAWGSNLYGQTNVPSGLTNIVAIGLGNSHSVALKSDGTVVAWGDNSAGQTIVPMGLSNVVAISTKADHTLALKADGTLVAWGDNTWGETNIPSNLKDVTAISASGFNLALKSDGSVVAWGGANFGGETNLPPDLTNVLAVSAGGSFGLALRADATVEAWGANQFNQREVPVGLTNVTAVSAGGFHSLALRSNGTVAAWGYDALGALDVPAGLSNVVKVIAGNLVSIALKSDGTMVIWGAQGYSLSTPVGLPPVSDAAAVDLPPVFLALAGTPQGKPFISFVGPSSQTIEAGSQAFFAVGVTGLAPLRYQWYYGSNALAGATNRTLIIDNASKPGAYHVAVSNALGTVTSDSVYLDLIPAIDVNMVPAITLKGSIGSSVRIDYLNAIGPTNAWTALATITLTNSPDLYFDGSAIGQPQRLYRVVQLP